jgi:hypothetical protein
VWYDPHPVNRLGRILLNALTALSLILFAATVALWVRSYWWIDTAGVSHGNHIIECSSIRGTMEFLWDTDRGHLFVRPSLWKSLRMDPRRYVYPIYHDGTPRFLGIEWVRMTIPTDEPNVIRVLTVPHAWVCALALVPSLFGLIRRRARSKPGLCPICGYDLRATPERCPECGTVPARSFLRQR